MSYKTKELSKAYYERNKGKVLATRRRWLKNHPDKQREYTKRYYQGHREQILKRRKEYNEKLRQRAKITGERWYAKSDEVYARRIQRTKEHQWEVKLAIIELFGGKCLRCGNDDPRVLQLNHISGNGRQERKSNFYRRILRGERLTDDLELLCANCNLVYEYERGRRYSN